MANTEMGIRTTIAIIKTAASGFRKDDAIVLAAALAFYSALSMAPLLLILVSVAGLIGEHSQQALIERVKELSGPQASDVVELVIRNAAQDPVAGRISTILAVGSLFLWTTAAFAHLQRSMNRIWGVETRSRRGALAWLRRRILSLGMVGAVGLLLLLSLVMSTASQMIFSDGGHLWKLVNLILPLFVFTLLFAMIFKFLPDVRINWGDVWVGAAITAGLFSMGKYAVSRYLTHSRIGFAYGTASSLAVLLVWVYYVSVVAFFGAELTKAYALHRGSHSHRPHTRRLS